MGGAFQTSREIFEHPIWQDIPKFRIFFYIVGNAVFSKEGVMIGDIHVQRGQYLRSLRNLQDDLAYREGKGNRKHMYPLTTLRRKIKCLVNEERITTKLTDYGTLFTVVNYESYQGFENYGNNILAQNRHSDGTVTAQQRHNNKKVEEGSKKVNKDKEEKTIREIKDLRAAFPPDLIELVDTYWSVIKKTRKTNTIAYSVILKTMQQWAKHDQVVIKYALKKHIEAYDDGERDENYTLGIMRNTKPEEAEDMLNKKVMPFKPKKGAPNYDEPPRSHDGSDGKPTHIRLYK